MWGKPRIYQTGKLNRRPIEPEVIYRLGLLRLKSVFFNNYFIYVNNPNTYKFRGVIKQ